MAEEPSPSDGQAPADARSQAEPNPSPSAASRTGAPERTAPSDAEDHAKVARDLRAENARFRTRIKALEDAQLTDTQRLERDRDAANTAREQALAELRSYKARAALNEAGATRAALLVGQLPDEAFDDEKAMRKAIEALRKDYPELFRSPNGSADGAAGRDAGAGTSFNDQLRAAMGGPRRRP